MGTVVIYDAGSGDTIEREETAEEIADREEREAANAALPPPVPEQISDRQFFQQLAIDGLITTDEALGAVMTGTLPAAMTSFISALPAEQQFGARMALCGATTFQRSHPLVDAFATMQGMTPEQIDELWRQASAL